MPIKFLVWPFPPLEMDLGRMVDTGPNLNRTEMAEVLDGKIT